MSGALVSVCVQPLDVVRTRIQADATRASVLSMVGTVRKIYAEGGTRDLWRGTGPTVFRLSIGVGIQFFILDSLKDVFYSRRAHDGDGGAAGAQQGNAKPQLTPWEAFVAGGAARAVAAAATCPITVVKTRMEMTGAASPYTGTLQALGAIARTDGARGLFRGLGPTVLANAPFSALYYTFYSSLQRRFQKAGAPSAPTNFAAGVAAAVAATLLTQPADMLRTHMQLGVGGAGATLGVQRTLAAIMGSRMGSRALLAGATPRVIKRTLQTALVWTLYEELQPRLLSASARLRTQQEPAGNAR
ncbi:hypothetical protein WJX81_001859 [Elliptochloris bilobata]|uniref:Mitochondrial carrier protein n=1 Tax=Elliptochloris bilobata TaxID=381761 RepID=A0AAW1QWJ6_9CHLO